MVGGELLEAGAGTFGATQNDGICKPTAAKAGRPCDPLRQPSSAPRALERASCTRILLSGEAEVAPRVTGFGEEMAQVTRSPVV